MTQSLIIDPNEVRRPGYVKFPEVPVNQYTFDRETELARYGDKGMVQMLHDMIVVRTFESMLDSIKKTGAWQGIEYNHRGPAHLGIGQESAYVGQSFVLSPEDFIFGSPRSPGAILPPRTRRFASSPDVSLTCSAPRSARVLSSRTRCAR